MENNLKIEIVKWIDSYTSLSIIREKVFIEEQKVIPQLEWDGLDEEAIHFLAYQNGIAIGCARAIMNNNTMQLGRMAVLKEYRHQGIGSALIEKAIATSKLNQLSSICLLYTSDAADE